MGTLIPHWDQPSHPELLEVISAPGSFTTKSISRVNLLPFAVFARLSRPPCTFTETPTYSTIQVGDGNHLKLNSDLMYINHSCEPSLLVDTVNFLIQAGPHGLSVGQELTFFYPSTEWIIAQPFYCHCNTPSCFGRIAGARSMTADELVGRRLNPHIKKLLRQRAVADLVPHAAATAA